MHFTKIHKYHFMSPQIYHIAQLLQLHIQITTKFYKIIKNKKNDYVQLHHIGLLIPPKLITFNVHTHIQTTKQTHTNIHIYTHIKNTSSQEIPRFKG